MKMQKGKRDNCISLIKLVVTMQIFVDHVIPSFEIYISEGFSFINRGFYGYLLNCGEEHYLTQYFLCYCFMEK
jgi:hypothetical protein